MSGSFADTYAFGEQALGHIQLPVVASIFPSRQEHERFHGIACQIVPSGAAGDVPVKSHVARLLRAAIVLFSTHDDASAKRLGPRGSCVQQTTEALNVDEPFAADTNAGNLAFRKKRIERRLPQTGEVSCVSNRARDFVVHTGSQCGRASP